MNSNIFTISCFTHIFQPVSISVLYLITFFDTHLLENVIFPVFQTTKTAHENPLLKSLLLLGTEADALSDMLLSTTVHDLVVHRLCHRIFHRRHEVI